MLVLLAGYFLIQGWRAASALSRISDEGDQITVALNAGDLAGAEADARRLRSAAHTAAGAMAGPLWAVAAKLPLVGHSVGAVRTSATVLDRIATVSLPTLLALADEVARGDLRPHDGRVDLAAVRARTPSIRAAAAAVDPAADRLAAVRTQGLIYPLSQLLPDLQQRVGQAKVAIDATADAFRILPEMLGADGPKRYLLVVQNPAEIRSTGGLPGSFAVLRADHGRVTMGAQGSAALLVHGRSPVRPTREEAALYGADLGVDPRDIGFNPDFSRAARMFAGDARNGGLRVDGVFAVDPIALAYVLRGTGGVPVGNGTLTADNAVPYLLNTVYQTVPSNDAQNAIYRVAARRVFDALVRGQGNQVRAIRGLVIAASQRRVLAWSPLPRVAAVIGRNKLSGALPGDTGTTPQIGIYYNDGVAGKIEYYLRQRTTAQSLGCRDGVQRIRVTTTLRSTVPRDVAGLSPFVKGRGGYATPGHILMQMALYSPWHGRVDLITVNGTDSTAIAGRQFGQQVGMVAIDLPPGGSTTVSSVMTTGPGQTGDIEVTSTPGMEVTQDPAGFTSACG